MRNKPSTIDELDILDLTLPEEKILVAISVQARHISDIASLTDLPRTSLLYILTKLRKRGLVKLLRRGKRAFYKSNFHSTLKQLSSIHSPSHSPLQTNEPDYRQAMNGVVIHEGVTAIMNIFERLADQPKNSRIYGIQPDNSINWALRKPHTDDWTRINTIIKEKSFIIEGIVHEKSVETILKEVGTKNALEIFNSFFGRLQDYAKIPDEFANVEAEFWSFGGSAFIVNWNTEVAIEIVDSDMVTLLLAMFSCVKELGQRYNQNEKMKQYADVLIPPNTPQ
jgi:DNA-binding transcriptional ArsR family regulator